MINYSKLPSFLIKLLKWEFWPTYIVYFPVFFYYLWLALKSKSFFFFSMANPAFAAGGLFGMSKYGALAQIPDNYKPVTKLFTQDSDLVDILSCVQKRMNGFPVIIKPDIGERGNAVSKIDTEMELVKATVKFKSDFILQEYVAHPIELGVLYYRMPGEASGKISSIVIRDFLKIHGNGKLTLLQLIENNFRAKLVLKSIKGKWKNKLDSTPGLNEEIILEHIGNHVRGTTFKNGNHLINPWLEQVFDEISKNIKGFYYGRYDLRCSSIEELYQEKNIKIVEVNGVNSEPAHIYDPGFKLLHAWRVLINHWNIIYRISKRNRRNGFKPVSIKEIIHIYKNWKFNKV